MTQILDTNVLIRHFAGAPTDQATAATAFLTGAEAGQLWLSDVHLAEFVWVLESSVYQADRAVIATALDAILALPAIKVADEPLLHSAIGFYSDRRMDWIDAYLVATAIRARSVEVVSFDRFDSKLKGLGVRRLEPPSN